MRASAPVELEPPPEAERSRRLWSSVWSRSWSRTFVAERPPAIRSVVWDKRGFPLTNKLVVCSTCQLPKEEVEVNQERHNLVLARLQMLHALPYRLLPKLMNAQSEGEQIVEKSAASKFGYILTRSSKTDRSGRAKIVTTNPKFLLRARELS